MPRPVELALNNIVMDVHSEREHYSEAHVKTHELVAIASDLIRTYGDDARRGQVADQTSGDIFQRRETRPINISIPFSTFEGAVEQEVSLILSDATEKGNWSGSSLDAFIPSLSDSITLFYFRTPPLGENPTLSVKNWKGQYATMAELIVADQLLTFMDHELSKSSPETTTP